VLAGQLSAARFRRDKTVETTLEVGASDLPWFDVQEQAELLLNATQTLNVEITSVAFAEGNKWRLNDGRVCFGPPSRVKNSSSESIVAKRYLRKATSSSARSYTSSFGRRQGS
jgi:hypothetical protein